MTRLGAARLGTGFGLACLAPVAVWTGGRLLPAGLSEAAAPAAELLGEGVRVLQLLAGFAVALLAPPCAAASWRCGGAAAFLTVAVPLPFAVVAWHAGAGLPGGLPTGAVVALAAGLVATTRLALRAARESDARAACISGLQVAGAVIWLLWGRMCW